MKNSQPEFRLTVSVRDYLDRMKVPCLWFSHWPNGENRPDGTGARLKRMGVIAGVGDFLILHAGIAYALELKLATDPRFGIRKTYQSPEQKAFQTDWEAAGGVYCCAHGYDEAIAFLAERNLVRPDRNRAAA